MADLCYNIGMEIANGDYNENIAIVGEFCSRLTSMVACIIADGKSDAFTGIEAMMGDAKTITEAFYSDMKQMEKNLN